jgi:hypothetical protein
VAKLGIVAASRQRVTFGQTVAKFWLLQLVQHTLNLVLPVKSAQSHVHSAGAAQKRACCSTCGSTRRGIAVTAVQSWLRGQAGFFQDATLAPALGRGGLDDGVFSRGSWPGHR